MAHCCPSSSFGTSRRGRSFWWGRRRRRWRRFRWERATRGRKKRKKKTKTSTYTRGEKKSAGGRMGEERSVDRDEMPRRCACAAEDERTKRNKGGGEGKGTDGTGRDQEKRGSIRPTVSCQRRARCVDGLLSQPLRHLLRTGATRTDRQLDTLDTRSLAIVPPFPRRRRIRRDAGFLVHLRVSE